MAVGRVAKAVVALCVVAAVGACDSVPFRTLGFTPRTVEDVPPPPLSQAVNMTFAVAPPTGVPGNMADALIRQIRLYGGKEGLKFPTDPDEPTDYVLRSHLNAVGSYSGATVSYTIDVYDAQGRHATRIVGSVPGGNTYADPWSSASNSTMTTLAVQIAFKLRAWLFSGS